MLSADWLLFPPSFVYAANASNYDGEDKIGVSEPLSEAKALLFFAEQFLATWPKDGAPCKSFVTSWKNPPLNIASNVARAAIHDYGLVKNTIDAIGPNSKTRKYDLMLYRYWFGIRHIDSVSGKITYYPTLSEILTYHVPHMNRIQTADGSKEGEILNGLRYDGLAITQPYGVITDLEIKWDDGSISVEPYTSVVHMTPQGRGSSRIQDYLGAYRNGLNVIQEKDYNDIPEKMAVMMVYMAFSIRKYPRANTSDLLWGFVKGCAATQQPANLTSKYVAMKEIDATVTPPTVVGVGWASKGANLGFNEIKAMWIYVTGSGSIKVASWGVFPSKFLDDIEYYSIGDVSDVGLVVCPYCKKCDYLEDANFIDFGGYFRKDSNPLTSITYKPTMTKGVYHFEAIGLIKCDSCQKGYYRKFNSEMRSEAEQMPEGSGELALRLPYSSTWVLRSHGKGARQGEIRGYMFREHQQGNLPSIIFYLYYAGMVKAVEYPLEVGKMSRNGLMDLVCMGLSIKDGQLSHTYYDNHFAPDFYDSYASDHTSQKGLGLYRGPQADWSGIDPATGMKSCKLCDKNKVDTTLGEGTYYQNGARLHMVIDRGDGSTVFDRPEDFIRQPEPHYKIRLTSSTGDRVRYLEVPPHLVGVALNNAPPVLQVKIAGSPCPNDLWIPHMNRLIEEYANALTQDRGLTSAFLVCEGLAWSARYKSSQREWGVSQPKNENSWVNNFFYDDGTSGEIDETTWDDGINKDCELSDGTIVKRFPAFTCNDPISYENPYASCMSVVPIQTTHMIVQSHQETETVDTPSGQTTKIVKYYTCMTCEESYASCDPAHASQFIIPGATDSSNVPSDATSDRGIYSPSYQWHFTHYLYAPHNKTIEDLWRMDETKDIIRRYIPKMIGDWLDRGKTFPSTGKSGDTSTDTEEGEENG
jgi:hypothetical protein